MRGDTVRIVSGKALARAVGLLMAMACALLLAAPAAAHADATPYETENMWANNYGVGGNNWWQVPNNYLVATSSGYQRVTPTDDGLVVEDYSTDFKLLSSKTVAQSTYAPSNMAAGTDVLWGGFYAGATHNYVAAGQENPNESTTLPVLRVTKFTKDWQPVGSVEYADINTTEPFHAGSCCMLENGGVLYVRTCHKMNTSGDGLRHQASMLFVINQSDMSKINSYAHVSNITTGWGYVSHSFNQKIAKVGSQVFFADHGDAYPRSIVLSNYYSNKNLNVVSFYGAIGANATFASLGGLESSESNGTLLTAYSTIDVSSESAPRNSLVSGNVYISCAPSSLTGGQNTRKLTNYASDSLVCAGTPQIVKVNDNLFVVMWGEFTRSSSSEPWILTPRWNEPFGATLKYVFVDGWGNLYTSADDSAVHTATGMLSDCQPIVKDQKVV